jgi:hypothetical protein
MSSHSLLTVVAKNATSIVNDPKLQNQESVAAMSMNFTHREIQQT